MVAAGGSGSARPVGCADVTRACGVDPLGTASTIRSWLLVEHAGPWDARVRERLLDLAFDAPQRAHVQRLWEVELLRPLVIRRPGRAGRRPAARRTVYVGSSRGRERWLERLEVADLRELRDLDLDAVAAGRDGHGERVEGPLLLACTHGSVDACCAVRGRSLVAALADRHAERTWEVTHLGGCRFAANLLVLPDGYLHGLLDPSDGVGVADEAVAGRVLPGRLRGRTGVDHLPGAAEAAVRQRLGHPVGVDDVQVVSVAEHADVVEGEDGPEAAGADVVVRAAGRDHAVAVRRVPGQPQASRCDPEGTTTDGVLVT